MPRRLFELLNDSERFFEEILKQIMHVLCLLCSLFPSSWLGWSRNENMRFQQFCDWENRSGLVVWDSLMCLDMI